MQEYCNIGSIYQEITHANWYLFYTTKVVLFIITM